MVKQADLWALSDLCTPWCVHVAATLRIADHIAAGTDLYLLKSVLSDWPDRELIAILRRCAEAARPAGRVVALNGVSPDESGGPSPALLMMVLVGRRERSLAEFRELARAAGLEVQAAERQPSGRFVVECRPTRVLQ